MAAVDPRIRATVVQLLRWLVNGDFSLIEQATNGVRLSSSLLQQAVVDYGHVLIMPPAAALDQLDVIEVIGSHPKTWSIRVDLWTADEGRCDLSLECTLIDCPGEMLAIEVDNLHVL